jgi:hypothetical protein
MPPRRHPAGLLLVSGIMGVAFACREAPVSPTVPDA